MSFNEQVIDLLDEETKEKLSTITKIRRILGTHETGVMDEKDIESTDGLTHLLTWYLAPMEAIAAVAHDEIVIGNLITADMLMNDLRLKMKRFINTIEKSVNDELEEVHLKSLEQKETPEATPPSITPGA